MVESEVRDEKQGHDGEKNPSDDQERPEKRRPKTARKTCRPSRIRLRLMFVQPRVDALPPIRLGLLGPDAWAIFVLDPLRLLQDSKRTAHISPRG